MKQNSPVLPPNRSDGKFIRDTSSEYRQILRCQIHPRDLSRKVLKNRLHSTALYKYRIIQPQFGSLVALLHSLMHDTVHHPTKLIVAFYILVLSVYSPSASYFSKFNQDLEHKWCTAYKVRCGGFAPRPHGF